MLEGTLTFRHLTSSRKPIKGGVLYKSATISHPDIRVKYCAYGRSVITQLNPRGVTTVSHKYSLNVIRHATVVMAVPSTVRYPANYKMELYYFR
jgi:hypothetical protein